jgi:hypothetical protein
MVDKLIKRRDDTLDEYFLISEDGKAAFESTIGSVVGESPYDQHSLVICGRERLWMKTEQRPILLLKHFIYRDRDAVINAMSEDHVLLQTDKFAGRWDEDFLARVDAFNDRAPKNHRSRVTLAQPPRLDPKGKIAFHLGELRRLLEAGSKRLHIKDSHMQAMLESVDRDSLGELIDTDIPSVSALAYAVLSITVDDQWAGKQRVLSRSTGKYVDAQTITRR